MAKTRLGEILEGLRLAPTPSLHNTPGWEARLDQCYRRRDRLLRERAQIDGAINAEIDRILDCQEVLGL